MTLELNAPRSARRAPLAAHTLAPRARAVEDVRGPRRSTVAPAAAGARAIAVAVRRTPGGTLLVAVRGVADHDTVPDLIVSLERLRRFGAFALDLSELHAEDTGVLLITSCVRCLHRRSEDGLILVCPSGPIRAALDRIALVRPICVLDETGHLDELAGTAAARPRSAPVELAANRRPATLRLRAAILADAAISLQRRHPEPTLDLHDVASEIATSSRQLQRILADFAATSFRDELATVRIEHAATLLYDTYLTVAHIAHAVGYRQPAQFAKAFRRHVGVTPTTFRRSRHATAQTSLVAGWQAARRSTADHVEAGPPRT